MRHTRTLQTIAALAIAASSTAAQAPTQTRFGAYVDAYYAYDFGRPTARDRAYTTQAARHDEFNFNLAHVEASLSGERVRGRVALQAGTSVHANYAGEPAIGVYSGPTLARHVQEAYGGFRVADNVWVDGGVFFSHIGSESWISRDNLTYTRSIIAEYTPYYETGVRVTWQPTSSLTATAVVVNGWQIISENNENKSVGARLDWVASPRLTLGYYNIVGNEQPTGAESRTRLLNGLTARFTPSDRLTVLATGDFGRQDGAGDDDASTWWGGAAIARWQATERVGIAGRIEAYEDEDQVIIVTGTPDPFKATGVSFGIDFAPQAGILWRTELRALTGKEPVFPDRDEATGLAKSNMLVVTSFAITF
jgi:hypothetical protein